jgi:hypothetical protein
VGSDRLEDLRSASGLLVCQVELHVDSLNDQAVADLKKPNASPAFKPTFHRSRLQSVKRIVLAVVQTLDDVKWGQEAMRRSTRSPALLTAGGGAACGAAGAGACVGCAETAADSARSAATDSKARRFDAITFIETFPGSTLFVDGDAQPRCAAQ